MNTASLTRIWGLKLLLTFWAVAATPALPAGERMSPETLWKLGRLEGGALSPDGEHVAHGVRRFRLADNEGSSEIHVLTLQSGEDRVVVQDLKSSPSDLQWAATTRGPRLFFVSKRGDKDEEKPQVWSVDPATGKLRQVTAMEEGVANLKVSPSGTHLAFTTDIKMDATVQDIYKDLPKADARIIDSLMYRHWNAWHDYRYSHLHVAPLERSGKAGEALDLLRGLRVDCPLPPFGGADHYAWSPDGKEIAYTAKIVNNWAESTDSDIYLVDTSGEGATRCVTPGMDGYDTSPRYSPDGRFIAFHSMERPGFEADRDRIMVYDRSAGTIEELTQGLDRTTHGATWAPDSGSVYFTSEHRGTVQVFQVMLGFPGARQISRGRYNWSLRGVSNDGKTLLAARQSMIRPYELAILPAAGGEGKVVTKINDGVYKELELPTIEERWVRASDGKKIHNWVIYPPDFDPSRKWPMLTYCQGGPQGQIGQWFSFRWNFHLMAAQGYVVLAVNRRGLPGFGRDWNDQISGDWGGQAMRDILAATDHMMTEPSIDRRRVAAIGASFGGYTVYWLMGNHNGRFSSMVAHCGVFNLESMYGSTEELFFVNWDLGGPYWKSEEVRELYARFSPHRYIQEWKTPLLVIHGERDFRVPVTQGMEAFTAAQVQGIPSRFLYFPEEGHWVLSPQNGVLWHRVFFDWLDRYTKERP